MKYARQKGTGAYLLSEDGHRIRKCYLQAKMRYSEFVHKKRPIDASWEEYQQWNDWCASWYGSLIANKDQAVEDALIRKRKEKACRRALHQRSAQRSSKKRASS